MKKTTLPYDKKRTRNLPVEDYLALDEKVQLIFRFANALRAECPREWKNWDAPSLEKGIQDLKKFEGELDGHNFGANTGHLEIYETVGILRHLASAMFGPLQLLQSETALSYISSLRVKNPANGSADINVVDELGKLTDTFKSALEPYAILLLRQARSYGWREHAPGPYGKLGRGYIPSARQSQGVPRDFPPYQLPDAKFLDALKVMRGKLNNVQTRAESYFTSRGLTVAKLDYATLFSGHDSALAFDVHQVHDRLVEANCMQMLQSLAAASKAYDNHIKRSNRETPELEKARVLIEIARVQFSIGAEMDDIYSRHIARDFTPADGGKSYHSQAREILLANLAQQHNAIKAVSLAGHSGYHLVTMAKTIIDPVIGSLGRKR